MRKGALLSVVLFLLAVLFLSIDVPAQGQSAVVGLNGSTPKIDIPDSIVQERPHIYTRGMSRDSLSLKLKGAPWANKLVADMKSGLEPYIHHFEQDDTWMVSRLQMYWKSHHTDILIKGTSFLRAEGSAPVPTVRYTGSRDVATVYTMPKLEDLKPYDEREDGTVYVLHGDKGEWVEPAKTGAIIEKINEQILNLGQDAAFLYWYTGKEIYAKFALSIWIPYVKGLFYRNFPVNQIQSQESYLTGLTSYEVIHEFAIVPVTVAYDFLDKYLQQKSPDFARDTLAPVLKKMADNIIDKGVPDNNWNIFESRFLAYIALALDNNKNYADGKGASYYLDVIYNQNFPRQAALTNSLRGFDPNTGIWHEAPGYSISVSKDFLKIVLLTDGVMPNRLQPVISTLKKAVLATSEYLFPDKFSVSFGDSHYNRLSAESLECLISWSRKYQETADERKFTSLLRFSQREDYNRKGDNALFELFQYADPLMDTRSGSLADFASATFYAPNESWFVQRNGFDRQNGLMISSNASEGNHSHANGISIELYGKGYPLALDFGSGDSYWSTNYKEFYSQFAAHNTVVVNGSSSYGAMLTNYPFSLRNFYPAIGQKADYFTGVTFSNVFFNEPSTQSDQLRLLSIIRTSDSTGYYVDIFRSRQRDGKDKKHEYLYHNIGQEAAFANARGSRLMMHPTEELSSSKGDIKGYDYFTDKLTADFSGDFKVSFGLKWKGQPEIRMNLWMRGDSARQLFSVKSPKSYAVNSLFPQEIVLTPIPTLVVRQPGEAWKHPFVAVMEPSYPGRQEIKSITPFTLPDPEFVGLKVSGWGNSRQYIFSDVSGKVVNEYEGYSFTGEYGVASETGRRLEYLFLGKGSLISKSGYSLSARDSSLTAVLEYKDRQWRLYAEGPVELQMPFTGKGQHAYLATVDKNNVGKTYTGTVVDTKQARIAVFDLPALPGDWVSLVLRSDEITGK